MTSTALAMTNLLHTKSFFSCRAQGLCKALGVFKSVWPMIDEALSEIQSPPDICSVTDGIAIPSMPDICLDVQPKEQADIFKVEQRKSWDKSEEARCDFSYKLGIVV